MIDDTIGQVLDEIKNIEKSFESHNIQDQISDAQILSEIGSLESRFDRHLQIYAENGKESKRVADALERLLEQSDVRDVKVDAMYADYAADKVVSASDGRRMKTVVLWGATIAAAGVILALVRQVVIA